MRASRISPYEEFKKDSEGIVGRVFVPEEPTGGTKFSSADVVKRAYSMVQKGRGRPKFGSWETGNNCEHFANWCRSDQKICLQHKANACAIVEIVTKATDQGTPLTDAFKAHSSD